MEATIAKTEWTLRQSEASRKLAGVSVWAQRLFWSAVRNPKRRRVLDVVFNEAGEEVVMTDRGALEGAQELIDAGLARETSRRRRRVYDAELGWTIAKVYLSVPELV